MIVNSKLNKTGTIQLVFDNDTVLRFPKDGIRAGLSWPQQEIPAYYVILGMEMRDASVSYSKSRLILLTEREVSDLSLEGFFQQLGDDCKLTCCQDIYAQVSDRLEEYSSAFYEYTKKISNLWQLFPAYFPDNFDLGVSLIRDHLDKRLLQLPEDSILLEQLKQIRREDLKDNPEKRFYAINALRHALSSFFRNQPVAPIPKSRPRWPTTGPHGWMAV
jgi:hypothetical protein